MAGRDAPLDGRIRRFPCGDIVETYAVVTERHLVLVDTAINPDAVARVMDHLVQDGTTAGRSLLVVNTHGDWDHVWGNSLFAGRRRRYPAPIIGNTRTVDIMRSPEHAAVLAELRHEQPGLYDQVEICPPTITVSGEAHIDGGDLTLTLLETPGHTPDHLSVWIPELRLLLVGDAAEAPFPFVDERSFLPELRASLHWLDALRPRTALYSHVSEVTDPALIRHNIAYLDELERRCRAAGPPASGEDPAAAIDWPAELAAPPGVTPASLDPDSTRLRHNAAIQAMFRCLQT